MGGPAGKSGDTARVTINRKGLIYMNTKAYKMLGSPQAAALFYSREDDAIAIAPANPRSTENFQLVPKQNGWGIHAATFCRHYKIRVPDTERFIRIGQMDDTIILPLRETVTVGGIIKSKHRKVTPGS